MWRAKSDRHQVGGNRTVLLVNMRQMPANDFNEATLSVASKQSNVLEILTQTTGASLAVHPATALHGDPAWGFASWRGTSGCD